ncbi:MAG: hypothetical protein CSB49_02775 [Proteobacteria bacterium]|nr:MAG: hypothetical protein CSB49_02775 [Pseudomonadota bacterium]
MALLRLNTQDAVVDEEARLEALGIELLDEPRHPAVWAECLNVAKRLRLSGRQVVGLWPADDAIGVPSLAVQVGLALADLASTTVAFLDANARWPAARALIGKREAEASTQDEDAAYTTLWLRGMVALLIPRSVGAAGESLTRLRGTLEDARPLFGAIFVDMTGFDVLGDHLNVMELLEGVAIVAAAGRTTDEEVLELARQVPPGRLIGAVLVGS